MPAAIHAKLQRKIISLTLLVSLAPLLLLGTWIYYQFAKMHLDKIEEQIRYRARAQAEAVDLFLKERTAILSSMADTHRFQYMVQEDNLSRIFEVMNLRAGAFVDLGVIDSAGAHRAYVGPYDLRGLNYYDQPWFDEVMSKGVYISDVYTGYRQLPHFIIAVLRREKQQSWILRATIDPEIFGSIVRAAKVGKTGDAYIVNRGGVFQTRPRFYGEILSKTGLDPTLFGQETTVVEKTDEHGKKLIYAGNWLKGNKWLLIISRDPAEEMKGLFATRNVEIGIISAGILAIIITTILTTRMTINRLIESYAKLSELNAKLFHSDKLAALGKMGASVAHEINNPLSIVIQKIGWVQDLMAEEEFRDSRHFKEYETSLDKMIYHLERIRKVVHNMLGYARRMEPRLEDVDINETINQTIGLLENYARINNIDIQTDLSPDLPVVASDQSKLQQVFLNLISNAIDAIGNDGIVEVTSQKKAAQILVRIKDNGSGMTEEQQKKVFDPFYTTKATGKGTGLGLWVSYDIIEQMGGSITLKSEVGEGSTFTVQIPIVLPEKK
ncbi:MAG: ATP-binding protein [Deltaproteobacteria bacterium]|nr:MAG: ATP-binding protein [Deltaproteobacteria bacterium]